MLTSLSIAVECRLSPQTLTVINCAVSHLLNAYTYVSNNGFIFKPEKEYVTIFTYVGNNIINRHGTVKRYSVLELCFGLVPLTYLLPHSSLSTYSLFFLPLHC